MLFLTYAIDTDGAGAQYQRIIGIISLSRKYNIEYVHTPIEKIEHLPDDYIDKLEKFFNFNKNFRSVDDIEYQEEYEVYSPDKKYMTKLMNQATNKNILLKIKLPFTICDSNTSLYSNTIGDLRKMMQPRSLEYYENYKDVKKIAIHIRRGDVNKDKNRDRYKRIGYYKNIIDKLNNKYDNSHFFIFTEINDKNKYEFDIFKNYSNITILENRDLIDTIYHLINADIFVMGISSLSYVTALYNPNTVYYSSFPHKSLEHWVPITNIIGTNFWKYTAIIICILIIIILVLT